ncbi:hypothetical protein PMAC_002270 [Pneumocystis sp. 'macacae']|nr:hypothetical protein PMAC_002270 [Pneumocystis sp. 'macacae']
MENIQENTEDILGSDTGPEEPFPIYLSGKVVMVVKGYGRGTKELQIPTVGANISEENTLELFSYIESGIYYGWGRVVIEDEEDNNVYAMVMSLGWNPYYNNTKRSAEIHFIHKFKNTFYGEEIRVIIMGFIRPERNYVSKELLIKDIQKDIRMAQQSLERKTYSIYKENKFLEK